MDAKITQYLTLLILILGISTSSQAAGDLNAGKIKAQTCGACHGPDGRSSNNEWPNLAGQHAIYLYKQMQNFKQGKASGRYNEAMMPLMQALSDQDMQDIAAYYASLPRPEGETPKEFIELGQDLYRGGNLPQHITACAACHAPDGSGYKSAGFPALSGQHAKYVLNQLLAFQHNSRHNSPNDMMNTVVSRMTPAELEAVANYVVGLH